MKIRALMAVLAWGLATTVSLMAAASNGTDNWFAMPMAELEEVVTEWLDRNEYQTYRVSSTSQPLDQHLKIVGEKTGSQLLITLIPQSPLATSIDIQYENPGDANPAKALERCLQGYVELPNSGSISSSQDVPDAVRRQMNAVVCIYADLGAKDVQLSGFIIDPDGWVVCTAHDLSSRQAVTLVLNNGSEISGRVEKLDTVRDLALIKTQPSLPNSVSLKYGRYLLRNGDALFTVTCPNGGVNGIHPGNLDGPPRRVNGLLLWQARIHIDPGSSGSPVFDAQGRLAAVVKGRYRGTDSVGFLIPFETLLHFLDKYQP
jgi:serine protease Do